MPPLVTSVLIFAWRGGTEQACIWCIDQAIKGFAGGRSSNMILDDGGDLVDGIRGFSEETTTGVHHLYRILGENGLNRY